MEISVISKGKTQYFARLSQKKFRDETGLFIAEGYKIVTDLLKSLTPYAIIISNEFVSSSGHKITEIMQPGRSKEIIWSAPTESLRKISSFKSLPDIIGIFHKPEFKLPQTLDPKKFYLFLDDIQDPGNMGTLIRTADWFGIKDIMISLNSADIYNPKTIQSSMGSLSRCRIYRADLKKVIIDNPAISVTGTLLNGEDIFRTTLPKGGIVIMGNEGNGISEEIKKLITKPITIPPVMSNNHPDSLNVGVACGIVLAELTK